MSKSTILQLRQQESSEVEQNGVWQTTLDHQVLLEEGDQVAVKAVYLDTVSDTINLEEDTQITMGGLLYVINGAADQVYPYQNGLNWPQFASPNLRVYFDAPNVKGTAPGDPPPFPSITGGAPGTNGSVPLNGDNDFWFMANTHTTSGGATNWEIPFVEVTPINKTSATRDFGGLTLHFRHKTLTPGSGYITTPCFIKATKDKKWTSVNPFPLGVQCTGTATAPDCELVESLEYLNTWGIESVNFVPYQRLITAGEKTCQPEYEQIVFTIPAGIYTPAEIAKAINNGVGNLQYEGAVNLDNVAAANNPIPAVDPQWPSRNPFLKTILQKTQELQERNTAHGSDCSLCFVNADNRYGVNHGYLDLPGRSNGGELYFRYDVDQMQAEHTHTGYPLDKFVGTNQFSMDFDEVENKLKITQCHFPVYVNNTSGGGDALPGVAWNVGGANGMAPNPALGTTTAQFVPSSGIQRAYSGIAFTQLEPAQFWNDLGFNNLAMNVNFNKKMRIGAAGVTTGGDGGDAALPTDNNSFTVRCDVGINTTGALLGCDLPVDHQNDFTTTGTGATKFFGQYSVPKKITPIARQGSESAFPNLFVNTNDVQSIFSSKTINKNIADEGYFLIDVESNFRQDLIGGKEQVSKATQSIENRYYSDGAFTSDQGAGSISYTHRGEPQLLSSLKIMVKNPDGSFVSDSVLKQKNSVFVEIIKALPEDKKN